MLTFWSKSFSQTVPSVIRTLPSQHIAVSNPIASVEFGQACKQPDDGTIPAATTSNLDLASSINPHVPTDYSEYTEEELEFMQHLLEIRNTTTDVKPDEADHAPQKNDLPVSGNEL